MSTPTPYINDAVFQRAAITSQMWGGALLTDWENYILLRGLTSSGSTAYFSAFRRIGSTTDYQVPVGKILAVKALIFTFGGGNNIDSVSAPLLGYNDNAIGLAASGGLSNLTFIGAGGKQGANNNTAADVAFSLASRCTVPAGKYPVVNNYPQFPGQNGTPINTLLVGIEEDV